jgi:hypothetical protein
MFARLAFFDGQHQTQVQNFSIGAGKILATILRNERPWMGDG